MRNYAWLLSAALLAVGCTDGTLDDTSDTQDTSDTGDEWYEGPWQIASVTWDCAVGAPDEWFYEIMTDGLAGTIVVSIFETGDGQWPDGNLAQVWDEEHVLTGDHNVDWDDETGSWDHWRIDLPSVFPAAGNQLAGVNTLWDCSFKTEIGTEDFTEGSLAYMVTMLDDNASELDCVIWGFESEQYWNDHDGNSCVCFEANCTN